ncbi:MAG: NAD-dependent epimerase/dehydratase family protein [Chloroflexota bacterium]
MTKQHPPSVFVTGGTGFIGKHLVNRLVAEGYHVFVLSRSTKHVWEHDQVSHIVGDIETIEDFSPILSSVEAVYHLAVTTVPGKANDKIQYDAQTNLIGSLKLIEHSAKAGVGRFIFASSGGSIYGVNGGQPIPEDHATDPISAHGVSKLAVEKYLEIFQRTYGMSYRIARIANPYGEGQDPDRGQGFIAYALGKFARNQSLEIWGDGEVVRDYIHVSDVIDALWVMLKDEGGHSLYNVGSGEGYSINDIIGLIEQLTHQNMTVQYTAGRPADVPYNCLDCSRLQNELSWHPETSLAEGLSLTWGWIQVLMREREEETKVAI